MAGYHSMVLTSHVGEAAEQKGEEEVEDDEVADEHGGEKVRHTGGACHVDAVPHGLDPLSAEDAEDDHEAVHEVLKVPAGHDARPLGAHLLRVVGAEELHSHDGEDEDDDDEDEGEVPQGAQRVGHDGEDVVEGLPRLGQLEHPQQAEGAQHGEALDALGQQLDQGQRHDQEVEAVPPLLRWERERVKERGLELGA